MNQNLLNLNWSNMQKRRKKKLKNKRKIMKKITLFNPTKLMRSKSFIKMKKWKKII